MTGMVPALAMTFKLVSECCSFVEFHDYTFHMALESFEIWIPN